jgi:formylglycine-generating enzyme required for sulfatase activity
MLVLLAASCAREAPVPAEKRATAQAPTRQAKVTIHGDDRIARMLTWQPPAVEIRPGHRAAAYRRAARAALGGRLYQDADAAIPIYLALLRDKPNDLLARLGLTEALAQLLKEGDAALARADDDIDALRQAHQVAAVARTVAPKAPAVRDYIARVDTADRVWDLNHAAERDLQTGQLGESGEGALAKLREALRLRPGQARAQQGLAAVESGLIRRAEAAGERGDFRGAQRWLALAATVRPGSSTVPDARMRLEAMRQARVGELRDEGLRALQMRNGIAVARARLDEMLRIALPGDPAATELRQRIDLATHYGLFRPGQAFTDALGLAARGPEMVVVPHGAFRMGSEENETGSDANERPAHTVRFDRGFAMSRTEVTVNQFRQFIQASGYKTTASRRGFSLAYDELSGNFVRRSRVDWSSAYDGSRAADDLPVVHVSARDADAYAAWLATRTGQRYHVASEAEFEYVLRAGGRTRYPWGNGAPPKGIANLTGALDRSPSGREWANAFPAYGDGYWGPAPVARFAPNAFGLHDLAGNVSEWVADCWHDGYRRAPANGGAWINPGCRTRVVRGGAWASAPDQTRSAWRAPAGFETTNARIGFRVVRDL